MELELELEQWGEKEEAGGWAECGEGRGGQSTTAFSWEECFWSTTDTHRFLQCL